jgi:hypothetical protein
VTKNERRYLSGRVCMLCDMPLDRENCGSIYGPPCSEEVRNARRAKCLAGYKPRSRTSNTVQQTNGGEE